MRLDTHSASYSFALHMSFTCLTAIVKQKESVIVSSTSSIDEFLTFERGSVEEIGWNISFAWTWITLKGTDVINTLPSSCFLIHMTCSARCTFNERH